MLTLKPNLASYSRASYFRELHGDLDGAAAARCASAVSAGSGTVEGTAYVRTLLGDLEARRGRYGAAAGVPTARRSRSTPSSAPPSPGLALLEAGRGELAPGDRRPARVSSARRPRPTR